LEIAIIYLLKTLEVKKIILKLPRPNNNLLISPSLLYLCPSRAGRPKNTTMEFPKFLLGDNTDYPTAIFVVHTEYPRFIINLENDEVEWLEDFSPDDEKELAAESESLIEQATAFYDREISRYED
jgi:hypothetical protein